MSINTHSPVEIQKATMLFRMHLRHSYYPFKDSVIQQSIFNFIPNAIDVYNDSLEYQVKCKNKKNLDFEFYRNATQSIIVDIITNYDLIYSINAEMNNTYTYSILREVYDNIYILRLNSMYLGMLYNIMKYYISGPTVQIVIKL